MFWDLFSHTKVDPTTALVIITKEESEDKVRTELRELFGSDLWKYFKDLLVNSLGYAHKTNTCKPQLSGIAPFQYQYKQPMDMHKLLCMFLKSLRQIFSHQDYTNVMRVIHDEFFPRVTSSDLTDLMVINAEHYVPLVLNDHEEILARKEIWKVFNVFNKEVNADIILDRSIQADLSETCVFGSQPTRNQRKRMDSILCFESKNDFSSSEFLCFSLSKCGGSQQTISIIYWNHQMC